MISNGATDADANVLMDDGIDLGWTTSSTLGMGVKHNFNGVQATVGTSRRRVRSRLPDKKGEAGKAKALAR